jgi:hypothetical protein
VKVAGVLICTAGAAVRTEGVATGVRTELDLADICGACAPVSGTMGFAHAVRGAGEGRLNRKYAPPKKQQKIIITLSGTNTYTKILLSDLKFSMIVLEK